MVDKLQNGKLYRLTVDVKNPAGDRRRNPNYEPMRDAPVIPKGRLFRALSKRDWLLVNGHDDLAQMLSEDPSAPVTHLQRVTSYDSLVIHANRDPEDVKLNKLFALVTEKLAPAPDTFEVFLLEERAHEGTLRSFLQWLTADSMTPVIHKDRMIKLFREFEKWRDADLIDEVINDPAYNS